MEKPIQRVQPANTFIVHIRVFIQRQYDFRIVVADFLQGTQFPLQGGFIPDRGCNLHIQDTLLMNGNKIHLVFIQLSNENLISPAQ